MIRSPLIIKMVITLCVSSTWAQESSTSRTPVETLYQHVDIQRNPRFVVQGMNVNQQIRYQIYSSLDVFPPDEKGEYEATQTILNTALVQADPLSYAVFTQSLTELRGKKYTYRLNKFSEVISMKGHADDVKAVAVNRPQSKGVLISNVIDEDGWKELAQLTLFQPPETGRPNRSFVRKTTHDWGSLGSWYGKTDFTGRSMGRNTKRFQYQHRLDYIPPVKNGAPVKNPLPFEIEKAAFQAYEARGEIQYDQKRKRVKTVREIFHARGSISTTMLGIASTVDLDEKQIFAIQVTSEPSMELETPSSSESITPR